MPLKKRQEADKLAKAVGQLADLIGQLGDLQATGRIQAQAHPELEQVTNQFGRINETMQKALKAGRLTAAQQRSIARNFERIAGALEKGAVSER